MKLQNEWELIFTPRSHSSAWPWNIVLYNDRLCYDMIIFQIWKGSCQGLLRYEFKKKCRKTGNETCFVTLSRTPGSDPGIRRYVMKGYTMILLCFKYARALPSGS